MKLMTKIAGGLGVILAAVMAILGYGWAKKREGKKEARIESAERTEEEAKRFRKLDNEIIANSVKENIDEQDKMGFVIKENETK